MLQDPTPLITSTSCDLIQKTFCPRRLALTCISGLSSLFSICNDFISNHFSHDLLLCAGDLFRYYRKSTFSLLLHLLGCQAEKVEIYFTFSCSFSLTSSTFFFPLDGISAQLFLNAYLPQVLSPDADVLTVSTPRHLFEPSI